MKAATMNEPEGRVQARNGGLVSLANALPPAAMGTRGVVIADMSTLARFCKMLVDSGMAPKGFNAAACGVAIQMGLELGLTPMSAIRNIAVINGRPGIYGDAALALVRSSGLCEWIEESIEAEGDRRRAVCKTQRKGDPRPKVTTFGVEDARRAVQTDKRPGDEAQPAVADDAKPLPTTAEENVTSLSSARHTK